MFMQLRLRALTSDVEDSKIRAPTRFARPHMFIVPKMFVLSVLMALCLVGFYVLQLKIIIDVKLNLCLCCYRCYPYVSCSTTTSN